MPTYEYQCLACRDRFDVFQSFQDKTLRIHDICGGELQKVFHASGVVFKGSGYYVTDSRSNGSGKDEKSSDPAGAPKTESGRDSAPSKPKDDGAKDKGAKDGGTKEGGTKEGGTKGGGTKDKGTGEKTKTAHSARSAAAD